MNPAFIDVQNTEMVFSTRKGRFHALHDIQLRVAQGEFVTLIGHSGCGKSTLLNLIAGLLLPTSGVLLCDNKEIQRARARAGRGLPEPLASAMADLLGQRAPGRGAGVWWP